VKGGSGGSSRFKGVSSDKRKGKWEVKIMIDGRSTNLGKFNDEKVAARAYDEAAGRVGRPVNFRDAEGGINTLKNLGLR
jgi:hypothetical protein